MTSIDKSEASITDLCMSSGVIYQLVTVGSWHAAHTAVTAAHILDTAAYSSSRSNETKYVRLRTDRPEKDLREKDNYFYLFNVRQNLSTHFTRSNYGYLNSIIIIIMVTATINAND